MLQIPQPAQLRKKAFSAYESRSSSIRFVQRNSKAILHNATPTISNRLSVFCRQNATLETPLRLTSQCRKLLHWYTLGWHSWLESDGPKGPSCKTPGLPRGKVSKWEHCWRPS